MTRAERVVIVTDGERGSALAVTRSLGRVGWRVIVVGRETPAAASRFCDAAFDAPSPLEDRNGFKRALLEAVEIHDPAMLLPITDDAGVAIRELCDRLPDTVRVGLPEEGAADIVNDKYRTIELARHHGIETPETVLVRPYEPAPRHALELGSPVVVKPARSRTKDPTGGGVRKHSVTYAHDIAELSRAREAAGMDQFVLVQALCPGEGVGVEMVARDGEPMLVFQHRRLAEVPVTGGASALRESVRLSPELVDQAAKLVRALRFTGPIMVEFKVRGDQTYLMEINGRIWGSLPLATRCGVDFPRAWADVLTGSRDKGWMPELGAYPEGVVTYEPKLLLAWGSNVLLQRKRVPGVRSPGRAAARLALGAWLSHRTHSDFDAPDDPRPRRVQRARLRRETLGKVAHRGRVS